MLDAYAALRNALRQLPRYSPTDIDREFRTQHRLGGNRKLASPLVGIWRESNSGVMPVLKWSDIETLLASVAADDEIDRAARIKR